MVMSIPAVSWGTRRVINTRMVMGFPLKILPTQGDYPLVDALKGPN